MGRLWLFAVMFMLLPCGCHPKGEPPRPSRPPQPGHVRRDDFGLPLVIDIDAPQPPPEIAKPSPPIKEQPKSP